MSIDANIAIVQDGYAKFGSGDIPGLISLFTDDADWSVPSFENSPMGGSYHGHDEIAKFFGLLGESEDITRFEPLEFVAQNDKVVVLGELAATVTSTGKSYETDWVHVFHVRDGKIAGFAEFFDSAAAEKAFSKTATAEA